jgi:hypothetical protein
LKTAKEPEKQILCQKIVPNPSKIRAIHEGDNPSFSDEFINFPFFFADFFILVFLSRYQGT